ncbi:hypothetical protein GCM10010485_88430 [Streptosporangium carneum]
MGRALDHAFSLDRALDSAFDHALLLARDRARRRAFDHPLDRALDRALDLTRVRTLDRARDLARDLTLDLDLTSVSDRAVDHALNRARLLARALDRDLTRDLAADHACELDRDLGVARVLVHSLTLDLVALAAGRAQGDPPAPEDPREEPERPAVAPSARRLVGLTVRILPAAHRERYAEELGAELWDLAAVRATRVMQVLYAAQQLSRVWRLRCELRAPGRRGTVETLHRWMCWMLASQARTWTPLSALTVMAFFDVAVRQGWGSALLAAPTVWLLYEGIEWLRKRWGVRVAGREHPEDSG